MARIEPDLNSGCWLWSGARGGTYGFIKHLGRNLPVHRYSYEAHKGPIPAGMMVCHRCDTPVCVNPSHLFVGSARDNALDMQAKGRKATRPGRLNHFAKIGEGEAAEIACRLRAGETQAQIAFAMDVTKITVSQIACGKSWRHVTGFERRAPVTSRPDRKSKRPLRSRGFPKSRPQQEVS